MTRNDIGQRSRSKSASCFPEIRIAILGAHQVGKSAVSVRFMTKRYIGEYQHNVDNTYKREIVIENDTVCYELRDTSASVDNNCHVSWASCIAVIYAIDNRSSFNIAKDILQSIKTFVEKSGKIREAIPLRYSLIGNKNDLEHLRVISLEEGKALAKKFNARFGEISAANDYVSIYELFSSMIRDAYACVESSKQITSIDYLKIDSKLRTRSHTLTPSTERSQNDNDFEVNLFVWDKKNEDDSISVHSACSAMENRRSRYSLSEGLETLSTDSNSDINEQSNSNERKKCTDEQDEGLTIRVPSCSMTKKEKSRSSSKRSQKQRSLKKSGKSKSYSDLASSVREQNDFNTPLFLSDNISTINNELLSNNHQAENSEKSSAAHKNGWSILRKERPRLLATALGSKNETSIDEPSRDIQEQPKFKRDGSRSSVRKKFSTIFRPKIVIATPTFAN
ncbi:uncharacterized protein LOC100206304 [Hydra vulgaris]|uniref:small monomeric GTPase n=1 Tax=Hydra vulgaris TaxID=6087 RepID=A0ABM4D7K8_HYDVU